MKQLLTIILIFQAFVVFGQDEEKIMLQGKVTNGTDVEGMHILNTSSRFNSVTDAYGNFAITVRKGDTLIVSSVVYIPESIEITEEIFERQLLIVTMTQQINELDEVMLGPDLTGNLKTDIEKIEVKDKLTYEDVGLPGYKGKMEERIIPVYMAITPVSVDLEAIYKHLSGYYRKLRIRRKWDAQNVAVARMIDHYGTEFYTAAYGIPDNRLYDFLLFCVETTSVQRNFSDANYTAVLEVFEKQAPVYLSRMEGKKE